MACCAGPTDDYVLDDQTRVSVATEDTDDTDESDRSEILSTDYRNVTPLFRNIERENWEGVLMFLSTGKWSNSMLSSSNDHLRSPSPEIQVKTWVTAYDRKGEPEWSQLPIHAAISYLAPFVVVQKLIQLYPKGVHCTDNEGMLPAHLAFGFGAPDNVIAMLLQPFPGAVDVKGLGGRYPYECCDLGPNRSRGVIHKIVTEQVAARTRKEVEEELREMTAHAANSIGVKGASDIKEKDISELIRELLQDRKELYELKSRGSGSSPKSPKPASLEPSSRTTSVRKGSRVPSKGSSKMTSKQTSSLKSGSKGRGEAGVSSTLSSF